MRNVDTIIIGGGQAGLALSYCLTREGVQHVILERGRVGERCRRFGGDGATPWRR